MPLVDTFIFDKKNIRLIPERTTYSRIEENIYTIIIGKNGVGKSRLLGEIAAEHTKKGLLETGAIRSSFFGERVIAASTSPFDKFPFVSRSKKNYSSNYRYIGMRSDGIFNIPSATALISSAAKGILESIVTKHQNFKLAEVFRALEFAPMVEFIFKPSYIKLKTHRDVTFTVSDGIKDKIKSDLDQLKFNFDLELEERYINLIAEMPIPQKEQVFWAINTISRSNIEKKALPLRFDFTDHSYVFPGDIKESRLIDALFILLTSGLIRLLDLKLFKKEYGVMSLRRASSGEQCMLVLMLGIAGHISDNSLILIDEPEISLHPKWQESFMSLLINAFSTYTGCHFIIATHSPQIVSRLRSENCYILSLAKLELFNASDFYNRSADYQLAELFDAPGMMNEYISRIAFNLLAKVKSTKTFNQENREDLDKLIKLTESVGEEDPIFDLVTSIKEVCKLYAND